MEVYIVPNAEATVVVFFLITELQDIEPQHKEIYIENICFQFRRNCTNSRLFEVLQ